MTEGFENLGSIEGKDIDGASFDGPFQEVGPGDLGTPNRVDTLNLEQGCGSSQAQTFSLDSQPAPDEQSDGESEGCRRTRVQRCEPREEDAGEGDNDDQKHLDPARASWWCCAIEGCLTDPDARHSAQERLESSRCDHQRQRQGDAEATNDQGQGWVRVQGSSRTVSRQVASSVPPASFS